MAGAAGQFAESQAAYFLDTESGGFELVDHSPNDLAGFSATLFYSDSEQAYVLAIRGTEDGLAGVTDLLADAQLSAVGVPTFQLISLYRYYRCLITPQGSPVEYTDSEIALLHQLITPIPFLPSNILSNAILDQKLSSDVGLGVLDPDEQLIVVGHSLGGNLATLFSRLFPDATEAVYTFNAPGTTIGGAGYLALAGVGPIDPSKVFNVVADYGLNATAAMGTHPGTTTQIFIEGGVGSENHQIARLTDSLALYDLFQTLSPDLSLQEISAILSAASSTPADSLESALDFLRGALAGDYTATPIASAPTDTDARNAFYLRLYDLMDRFGDGTDLHITSLVGTPAFQLASSAASDLAIRYALSELMPFEVTGMELDPALELLSAQWLDARADFLSLLMQANTEDQIIWLSESEHNSLYVDVDREIELGVLNANAAIAGQGATQLDEYLAGLTYQSKTLFGSDDPLRPDQLVGSDGDDRLFGNAGDDAITGGGGGDILEGGQGSDALEGGTGFDLYIYVEELDSDTIFDSGGSGAVEVDGAVLTGGYYDQETGFYISADGRHSYELSGGLLTIDGVLAVEQFTNGDLGITLSARPSAPSAPEDVSSTYVGDQFVPSPDGHYDSFGNLVPNGSNPGFADLFIGAPGNTLLDTAGGDDIVEERFGGSDVIVLGDGDDFAFAGRGDDWVEGGSGFDVILGGRGDDVLFAEEPQVSIDVLVDDGGSSLDRISGGEGQDSIFGSGRGDSLEGGAGSDSIYSGSGDDLVRADGSAMSLEFQEQYDGLVVTGEFTAVVDDTSALSIFDRGASPLPQQWPDFGVAPEQDDGDDLVYGDGGADSIFGGGGNDSIHGGPDDDVINGDGGDDDLRGDEGNDQIYGGTGNDVIDDVSGLNSLNGDAGDDRLEGGYESDLLRGGDGHDTLVGGLGVDNLDGGAGEDVLDGGAAPDLYVVGDGDTFIVRPGEANDLILPAGEFPQSATLLLENSLPAEVAIIVADPFQHAWAIWLLPTDEAINFDGSTLAGWSGLQIEFEDGTIWTGADIAGREIHSVLELLGSHAISGTDGSDFLAGTNANDYRLGGSGDDVYFFEAGGSRDVIDDREGNDSLFLGGVSSAQVSVFVDGADYLLRFPGSEIRLVGQAEAPAGVEIISFDGDAVLWTREDLDAHAVPLSDSEPDPLGISPATPGSLFSFTLPQGLFDGVYTLGTASVEVATLDAAPLPSWLHYDADAAVLSGTPNDADAGITAVIFELVEGGQVIATAPLVIVVEEPAAEEPTGVMVTGGSEGDALAGGEGDDTLDGGAGRDVLAGAAGDDTYIVDLVPSRAGGLEDYVVEIPDGGIDALVIRAPEESTPHKPIQVRLPQNVENLDMSATGSLALNGVGNEVNNEITGNSAPNLLDGASGADTLRGGAGNDTYLIDNAGDVVEDSAGVDSVLATVSWTPALDGGVNNITLLDGAISVAGTDMANVLLGNSRANILDGKGGNDTIDGSGGADALLGGEGNDLLIVDNTGDVAIGSGGVDTVRALVTYSLEDSVENLELLGTRAANGTGNALPNNIVGNAGNNRLDGRGGADTLDGGAGNDIYIVDNENDVLVDSAGTDAAISSASFTLSAGVENLTLAPGVGDINGTGNALGNAITGNAADNVLDGRGGRDTLAGGNGDDTYIVDLIGFGPKASLQDKVKESEGEGIDTLTIRVSHGLTLDNPFTVTLSANVENLDLRLTGHLDGLNAAGNGANNLIQGNSGNNILSGLGGNDTLVGCGGTDVFTGGDGNDTFVIDAMDRLVAIIGDFHHGEDLIGLGASYAGLFSGGTLQDGVFTIGAAATETGHRLIYNSSNGSLYYDGDGSGAGAAVEVANFSPGLALTTSDFLAMID